MSRDHRTLFDRLNEAVNSGAPQAQMLNYLYEEGVSVLDSIAILKNGYILCRRLCAYLCQTGGPP